METQAPIWVQIIHRIVGIGIYLLHLHPRGYLVVIFVVVIVSVVFIVFVVFVIIVIFVVGVESVIVVVFIIVVVCMGFISIQRI